jgi:hypothetical protein
MANSRGSGNPQSDLNGMAPAANVVRLGDTLNDLILAVNGIRAALIANPGAPVLTSVAAVPNRLLVTVAPEIPGDLP